MKTILGGVHFELTGQDVTECVGGPQELSESDLSRSYETYCDPSNYAQSKEMAFLMAQRLQMRRREMTKVALPNCSNLPDWKWTIIRSTERWRL